MRRFERGQLSLQVLIFGMVAVILVGGFTLWTASFLKFSVRDYHRSLAFAIAEAGIEYYRWHLAHAPADYQDGTGGPGPYVHAYYDKNGVPLGNFSLAITPPPAGSTIVTIRSTGKVLSDASIEKIIEVRMGIASLAKYVVVANDFLRFTTGTEVFGEVISNKGIRFDALAHNVVYSVEPQYGDPDHGGGQEFGVHTHVAPQDPLPPAPVPTRQDVFMAGRQFPVPAVDFTGLTAALAQIRSSAQSTGLYFGSSTAFGYHFVLKTNDTFDLYRVTGLTPKPPGCTPIINQEGWGTWSIQNETLIGSYPFPTSGVVFAEDDAWVNGQIDTARLTIGAGQFPETSQGTGDIFFKMKNITVNNDLLYTNYDGRDVLGLFAQKNVNVGLVSEDDLRIDAAMIAKEGRVGRYNYRPEFSQGQGCAPYNTRSLITTYGMIVTNRRYGFGYADASGYATTNLFYDANLLYNPPPSFPQTGDQYVQISWDEIK